MNKTHTKKLVLALLLGICVTGAASAYAAEGPMPVDLGEAYTFTILSKTGITDVYRSAIVGDVGTSPITGASLLLSCEEVSGNIYTVDAAGPLPSSMTAVTLQQNAIHAPAETQSTKPGKKNSHKNN